jgi:hypothetical protein
VFEVGMKRQIEELEMVCECERVLGDTQVKIH